MDVVQQLIAKTTQSVKSDMADMASIKMKGPARFAPPTRDFTRDLPAELLVNIAKLCPEQTIASLARTARAIGGNADCLLYRETVRGGDYPKVMAWAAIVGRLETIEKLMAQPGMADKNLNEPSELSPRRKFKIAEPGISTAANSTEASSSPGHSNSSPRNGAVQHTFVQPVLEPLKPIASQNLSGFDRRPMKEHPSATRVFENRYAKDDKHTPLQLAVKAGHAHIVKYLLKHGADPETKASFGLCNCGPFIKPFAGQPDNARVPHYPLHTAICTGNVEAALMLLKETASRKLDDKSALNRHNDLDEKPIHLAARFGMLPVVKYLVEIEGADINEPMIPLNPVDENDNGVITGPDPATGNQAVANNQAVNAPQVVSAFYASAQQFPGNHHMQNAIAQAVAVQISTSATDTDGSELDFGAADSDSEPDPDLHGSGSGSDGEQQHWETATTPLLLALHQPEGRAIVPDLLRLGANPNFVSPKGKSTVTVACEAGAYAAAHALLDAGADPVAGWGDNFPLHALCRRVGHKDDSAEDAALLRSLARRLLEGGFAGADAEDEKRARPLMALVLRGGESEFFLASTRAERDCAVEFAEFVPYQKLGVEDPYLEMARLLVEHGAATEFWARRGAWTDRVTPLHQALRTCPSLEVSNFLIEHGASTRTVDQSATTVLMTACAQLRVMHDAKVAHRLFAHVLNRGGNASAAATVYGATALHFAASARPAAAEIRDLRRRIMPAVVRSNGSARPHQMTVTHLRDDAAAFVPRAFHELDHELRGHHAAQRPHPDLGRPRQASPLDLALYAEDLELAERLVGAGFRIATRDRVRFWTLRGVLTHLHPDGPARNIRVSAMAATTTTAAGAAAPLRMPAEATWRFMAFAHGLDVETATDLLLVLLAAGLHADSMRVVTKLRVDPHGLDGNGHTPLRWAKFWGFDDVRTKLEAMGGSDDGWPRPRAARSAVLVSQRQAAEAAAAAAALQRGRGHHQTAAPGARTAGRFAGQQAADPSERLREWAMRSSSAAAQIWRQKSEV